MDDPARSVMSDGGGGKSQLISAFVAQHNNDGRREGGVNPGRAADKPLSTVTRTGSQQSVVAPYLQAYYGTGDGGEEDAPVRTVTTKDRHGHVEATLDVPPFTPAHADRARQVAAFLRSYGFWDDREFVTISAGVVTYVIVDIGMRMLVPRELYRAQGLQRVPACRRRARCRQLWSPRGAKGGCGMIKYATVALKSADFRNDLTRIMPGYSSYEVKSAGFGRHAPWMGHYRDGTLARAIRGLQDHYETTSRKYLILAQAMERGRKDKGGAA